MGYVEKTQWKWQERHVVELLLVRAVEENDPFFLTMQDLSEAAHAARDAGSAGELLDKRAAYLFRCLDKSIQAWARLAFLPENSLGFVMLGAFLVGALSNYLGPSGVVHVAYNPLAFLIVWNIGVYTLLGWRRLAYRRSATHSDGPFQASFPTSTASQHPNTAEDTDVSRLAASGDDHFWLPGFIFKIRSIYDKIRLTWNERMDQLREGVRKIKNTGEIANTFSNYYWHAARPVVIARVESLIHAGAIGLFLGAMLGTYVRGLFFEYNAVWRSTFLTDPGSVAAFLNVLLGPACLLINGTLLTPEVVQPLLSSQGTIAATWIHRLALMGALVILFPRAILAGLAVRHARTSAGRIEIDLSEGYYTQKLAQANVFESDQIREGITKAIQGQVSKFSESVALFVRDRFFDKIVTPKLVSFRNKGGRISDLEAELSEQRISFEPEILEHLQTAQLEFDQSVRAEVRSVVGKALARAPDLLGDVSPGSVPMNTGVTGSVAAGVGDAIGATVTTAVTAAVATISGGIGHHVGLAILASLLGTSGPIGLLIGGIATAVVFGGAYIVGRDRVASEVKRWRIPAPGVAIGLRDAKIRQAREATHSQVKKEIQSRLEPQVTSIVEVILQELLVVR